MNEDVAATDLAKQDMFGSIIEETGIVPGDGSRTPEQEMYHAMPQTGKPPVEESCQESSTESNDQRVAQPLAQHALQPHFLITAT